MATLMIDPPVDSDPSSEWVTHVLPLRQPAS
jgi:hypothetical protein